MSTELQSSPKGPTISCGFLKFLMSVDGDARSKDWVLNAAAFLVGPPNNIGQQLDMVGLDFGDLANMDRADAGQRSWLKR